MTDLPYIIASYGVTIIILLALVITSFARARHLKKKEAQHDA